MLAARLIPRMSSAQAPVRPSRPVLPAPRNPSPRAGPLAKLANCVSATVEVPTGKAKTCSSAEAPEPRKSETIGSKPPALVELPAAMAAFRNCFMDAPWKVTASETLGIRSDLAIGCADEALATSSFPGGCGE